MAFTPFTKDVLNVSQLPNEPSLEDGYTPEVLKASFDKAAADIKEYINNVLIPALTSNTFGFSASENLGSAPIDGIDGLTIHSQLASIKQYITKSIANIVMSALPNGCVDKSALSSELLSLINSFALKNELSGAVSSLRSYVDDSISSLVPPTYICSTYSVPGEYSFTAPKTALYRIRLIGGGSGGSIEAVFNDAGKYNCIGGKSGAFVEAVVPLSVGSVSAIKVGRGGKAAHTDILNEGESISISQHAQLMIASHITSAGEDTSITLDGKDKKIVAEGGSIPKFAALSQISDDAGIICVYKKDGSTTTPDTRFGGESVLGSGARINGSTILPAGTGSGGLGAQITLNDDNTFIMSSPSSDGGHGLVIIEQVN